MKLRVRHFFFWALSLLWGTSLLAKPLIVSDSAVTFEAIGNPGFLKIEGEGGKVEGSLNIVNGKVSGKLESLLSDYDTGIGLRNSHMRDKYLDVKNHPRAVLVIDPMPVAERGDFTGKLTLKKETKPIKGTYTYSGEAVEARFAISLKDYPSIGAPEFKGVSIAETVDVKVTFKVK